jgi:hypothetical protein
MKVTLLLPQELGNWFSLLQERRSARVLPQSLISLIYHIVAKPFPWLLTARSSLLLIFFLSTSESKYVFHCSSLKSVFSTLLSRRSVSFPELPHSFPSSTRLHGLNPNSWSGLEALQMGTLPHLLINS